MSADAVDPRALLAQILDPVEAWEAEHGAFEAHPSLGVPRQRLDGAIAEFTARLTAPTDGEEDGIYPFFHPRYAGQMLKPPHPVAWAAYAAAMRLNPNNHALDGGPATGRMEKEVVADLAAMFGFPAEHLGHLTGGGTVANLEALFVVRELAREAGTPPAIAVSEAAHYTHARMAHVLGLDVVTVPTDDRGRMDLGALEGPLAEGAVSAVVLTAGTTGLGTVDPIREGIALCRRYGARVHIDAAYGGFFRLLASGENGEGETSGARGLSGFPAGDFLAIEDADSVVVDPHKHGLQPYGCGAVLFRDPSVGRFYRHDSPYTYFTSDALHLGEISLECSRPGAAAAALWLTLRALPLAPDDGLGPVLAATLRAARAFARGIEASPAFRLWREPELDIVGYYPASASLSEIDAASGALFDRAMAAPEAVYLSLYRVDADAFPPEIVRDRPHARILRSVLMKPEHEAWAESLVTRLEEMV
ncbi:pyridoxal phosphate-dependent decarboxylase family protein [Rubricoccus marinus]|uniref:Aspartate aminotransferase family protein n=1 Tax=Rubricoccus marinus TaxID=716817 RepID=A0A259U184_9BACT|nr:aminotransferase class V-fold PLP-dependent enzyme [Rubricoccus marinus]OZC03696.1 aspartate aminotransferase family protein [Rubricoccus marinus]